MVDKARLHRSELAVPATNLRAIEKAPGLGADVVFLDLEDAVAPDDKERARANAIEALQTQDWTGGAVSVRFNGLNTHWCYRDLVEVVETCGEVLDTVLVPKPGAPSDIEFVGTLLGQLVGRYSTSCDGSATGSRRIAEGHRGAEPDHRLASAAWTSRERNPNSPRPHQACRKGPVTRHRRLPARRRRGPVC